jgi:hypothetical protein
MTTQKLCSEAVAMVVGFVLVFILSGLAGYCSGERTNFLKVEHVILSQIFLNEFNIYHQQMHR